MSGKDRRKHRRRLTPDVLVQAGRQNKISVHLPEPNSNAGVVAGEITFSTGDFDVSTSTGSDVVYGSSKMLQREGYPVTMFDADAAYNYGLAWIAAALRAKSNEPYIPDRTDGANE